MLLPITSAKENTMNILVSPKPICNDTIEENKHITLSLSPSEKTKSIYPDDLEKIFASDSEKQKNITHLLAEFHHHHDYFTSCNRQETYEELISRQPSAAKYKDMLEKSFFLYEWWYAYLEIEQQVKDLLRKAEAENLWTYSRFMQQSRNLTRIYNKKFNKYTHLYINSSYLHYLQEKLQDSSTSTMIRALLPYDNSQSTTSSFACTDHLEPWHDTLSVNTVKFPSVHLPARDAQKWLENLWYTIVSSRNWIDDGCNDDGDRTCTHWLQPIVLSWLKILEEKLKNIYNISMDHKIIRWGTERWHFFWIEKKWLIAGQVDPTYKKNIKLNRKNNNIHDWTIKEPRLLFTTHGYGTTIDLSIASPEWARAMEDFLSTWESIWLWYKLIHIWTNEINEHIYIISMQHGKDTNYHFHIWFISESQLHACNIITSKQRTNQPMIHSSMQEHLQNGK
jgi:hypothetical protein